MNQKENIQLPSAPIAANMALLAERERFGLTKYGVTLGDAGLSHEALLQHGLEEALDLANYLQTALATAQENAKYKAEYTRLVSWLLAFKDQLLMDRIDPAKIESHFLTLLRAYELDATRRGIRTCPIF